jgi:hypothetical protein
MDQGLSLIISDPLILTHSSLLHPGNYTRNFEEDESDKRYFGAKLDPLMSDSYNMRTKLVYEGTKRLDPELKRIMNARDKVITHIITHIITHSLTHSFKGRNECFYNQSR